MAVNPVLLQIAVINNGKRRKKREAADDENLDPNSIRQLEEIQKLENFLTKVPNGEDQSQQLLANYVDCSGLAHQSQCLEHLVCLYSNPQATSVAHDQYAVTRAEKDVIAM